jgi:hypothetical protein
MTDPKGSAARMGRGRPTPVCEDRVGHPRDRTPCEDRRPAEGVCASRATAAGLWGPPRTAGRGDRQGDQLTDAELVTLAMMQAMPGFTSEARWLRHARSLTCGISSPPTRVFDDLREESEELDRLVAELSPEGWAFATPAARWTVAHQIAHLAWTDHSALLAVTDADAFRALVEKALAAPESFVDEGAEEGAAKDARPAPRRLAGRAGGPVGRPVGRTHRNPLPLVRPTHVGRLHGHGSAYGDLGPWAGCRRRGRCGQATHGPAPACGAHRCART